MNAMMERICLIIVWITMERVRLNVKNRIVISINVCWIFSLRRGSWCLRTQSYI